MKTLDGGITRNGTGIEGIEWNILGQRYFPKSDCASSFSFEANSASRGSSCPSTSTRTQDEFILVQEGQLELKLDGVWHTARAGDLVRMPRGVPHGYFNKSDKPARALFWVSPAGKLRDLFEVLHNMTDIPAAIEASARHDVDFLPPEANE